MSGTMFDRRWSMATIWSFTRTGERSSIRLAKSLMPSPLASIGSGWMMLPFTAVTCTWLAPPSKVLVPDSVTPGDALAWVITLVYESPSGAMPAYCQLAPATSGRSTVASLNSVAPSAGAVGTRPVGPESSSVLSLPPQPASASMVSAVASAVRVSTRCRLPIEGRGWVMFISRVSMFSLYLLLRRGPAGRTQRLPEARVLRGREVDPHQRARPARRVEQMAGREQPALVQQGVGQRLGVDPRVDPAEQALRRCHEAAAMGLRELHAAMARGIEPRGHALGMAAQAALLQAVGHRLLQHRRRGQRRQQLHVDQSLDQR